MSEKSEDVYRVYVIALDDEILKRSNFRKRNPDYKAGKPCLYVGQSVKDPKERFKVHKAGGLHASKKVAQYGKYLRWKLFEKYRPVKTRAAAERLERKVALVLQAKGYAVWWN